MLKKFTAYFLLIALCVPVFSADQTINFVDGNPLTAAELNKWKNNREGNFLPVDQTTFNYSDGADSLGRSSNHWEDLWTGDGSNVALFVDGSAGSVGIGTSSPNYQLHATDSFGVVGTAPEGISLAVSSGSGITQWLSNNDNELQLQQGVNDSGFITLKTRTSGTNRERLRITNSGNIGIGTDNPESILHINQASDPELTISTGSGSQSRILFQENTADVFAIEYDGSGAGAANKLLIKSDADGNGVIENTAIAINRDGDVGIGTESSSSPLSIKESSNAFLDFIKSTDSIIYSIVEDGSSGIKFNNGADVLTMDLSGNVGIGVSPTPWAKLEIESAISQLSLNYDSSNRTTLATDSGGSLTIDPTGNKLRLNSAIVLNSDSQYTISSGAITITDDTVIEVLTEGGAASDDLATINGGTDGQIAVIYAGGNTVVCKDGTGNLQLSGDFSMDSSSDRLTLIYNSGIWYELSRSNNA